METGGRNLEKQPMQGRTESDPPEKSENIAM